MDAYAIATRFATVLSLAAGAMLAGAAPAAAEIPGAVVATSGSALNVRSGPATDQDAVETLADGTALPVRCKVRGEHIDGHVRATATWLLIGKDRWVSHAYVDWAGGEPDLPWCSAAGQRATHATVRTGGAALNVRADADAGSDHRGTYREGTVVQVECQVWGQSVDGEVAETNVWYRVGEQRHVAAAYVEWSAGEPWLPWCDQDPPSVPAGTEQDFIDRHAPAARDSRAATGVPASVTLAQAVLETGWGESALTREDHNVFGMKCFGSPGEHAIGCRDYSTFECSPTGGCFDMDATFRAYARVADSYRDHGELLSQWPRYATAMEHKDDPDRFAREIHKAGYATDPQYADKLIDIMGKYDLYRYDD